MPVLPVHAADNSQMLAIGHGSKRHPKGKAAIDSHFHLHEPHGASCQQALSSVSLLLAFNFRIARAVGGYHHHDCWNSPVRTDRGKRHLIYAPGSYLCDTKVSGCPSQTQIS